MAWCAGRHRSCGSAGEASRRNVRVRTPCPRSIDRSVSRRSRLTASVRRTARLTQRRSRRAVPANPNPHVRGMNGPVGGAVTLRARWISQPDACAPARAWGPGAGRRRTTTSAAGWVRRGRRRRPRRRAATGGHRSDTSTCHRQAAGPPAADCTNVGRSCGHLPRTGQQPSREEVPGRAGGETPPSSDHTRSPAGRRRFVARLPGDDRGR